MTNNKFVYKELGELILFMNIMHVQQTETPLMFPLL